MPSLGELFVELGVVGDVKPLEKAIGTMKEAVKQIDNEIKANQRLLKYLQDIKNARTAGEKATIKENFTNEIKKQKMLDEIDANQKAVDGKKEFASKIAGVVKGVGAFVGALTGAAIAMNKFTNDLVQSNQAMLDLTRTSDIALGTFQKWGSIGKMLGVNNVEQQLEGLNQRMFDLMLTGEGARGFQLAGINPVGQDAEGVLEQLRNRVSGMNDTTATYLLQQMGLDPRMLHLLKMTRDDFEELGRTIDKYRLSDDQTKEIQAMNIQLQIAGIKLKYLKDRAILALMPAWTQFMASLARVTEGLETAVKWVTDFISKSPGLQSALKGVAVALGIIFAVAHPLLALFGALYLIIDDIVGYFQGKDSLFGAGINYLQDYIQELKDKFGELSLDKVIPQVILDVGEVIIKAGKVTLERAHRQALKGLVSDNVITQVLRDTNHPHAADYLNTLLKSGPFQMVQTMYALTVLQLEKLKEIQEQNGTATGGAAPILSYTGNLPNLDSMFISPAMQRNISNSNTTTNTDNRQINMTNNIQTSQPVTDIQTQLAYARNAMATGWA